MKDKERPRNNPDERKLKHCKKIFSFIVKIISNTSQI